MSTINIARWTDIYIVDSFLAIGRELNLSNFTFHLSGIDGFYNFDAQPSAVETATELQEILALRSTLFATLRLNVNGNHILRITRPDASAFDNLEFTWRNADITTVAFCENAATCQGKV